MYARKAASYLLPRRRRLANGLVLGRRATERYVETFAVVAIVFVLAASAIDGYQYAIDKMPITEAANLLVGPRMNVAEHYAVTGLLPEATSVTDADGGRFFSAMAWRDGEVVLEANESLAQRIAPGLAAAEAGLPSISFRVAQTPDGSRQIFLCGFSVPPAGFTVGESRHSTISETFLPFFCRS